MSLRKLLAVALLTGRSLATLSLGLEDTPGYSLLAPCAAQPLNIAISQGLYEDCQSKAPPVTYVNCICTNDGSSITHHLSTAIATPIFYTDCSSPPIASAMIASAVAVFDAFCSVNSIALTAATSASAATGAATQTSATPGVTSSSAPVTPSAETGQTTSTTSSITTSTLPSSSTAVSPSTSTGSSEAPSPSAAPAAAPSRDTLASIVIPCVLVAVTLISSFLFWYFRPDVVTSFVRRVCCFCC